MAIGRFVGRSQCCLIGIADGMALAREMDQEAGVVAEGRV